MKTVGERCAERFSQHREKGTNLTMPQVVAIIDEEADRREVVPLSVKKPLFAALAIETGSDPDTLTKTAARAVAVALAEILEVSPDLTPAEIEFRVARYRQFHPQWPCTAMAICKNWSELGGGRRTDSAKYDPDLPPPANWKDLAVARFPSSLVSATPWSELSRSVRSDILRMQK